MNILSLKVKSNTAEDAGKKLEKTYEELEREKWKLQGVLDYLAKVEKDLNKVTVKVKEDILGDDPSVRLDNSLEVTKYIIERVMECARIVHEHMERTATAIPITEGKMLGIGIAVKNLHDIYKESKGRIVAIEKQLESGEFVVDGSGNVFSTKEEEISKDELTCHPSMFEKKEDEPATSEPEGTLKQVEEKLVKKQEEKLAGEEKKEEKKPPVKRKLKQSSIGKHIRK